VSSLSPSARLTKKYIYRQHVHIHILGFTGPKAEAEAIKDQLEKHLHVMVYGEYIQSTTNLLARKLADLLPGPLPSAVRTITGLVRPLVPAPVARLADAAPRSIKIARGLWEEVEEFQFTMLRKRTVRLASDEIDEAAEAEPAGAGAAVGSPTVPAATWAQADLVVHPPAARPAAALSDAAAQPEVTGRGPGEVAGRRRGAVKGRARRELPPASED